jgi:hypothetical protein
MLGDSFEIGGPGVGGSTCCPGIEAGGPRREWSCADRLRRADSGGEEGARRSSEGVRRGADTTATSIEDVGVDHGRLDVGVAQELLDGPDVVAGVEKVRGERMA